MIHSFTPGPWVINSDNEVCTQIDGEFHAICTDQFCFAPMREKQANARLIAAAPELLGALIGLRDILGRAESNASGNPEWEHVSGKIKAARAAIAKATTPA